MPALQGRSEMDLYIVMFVCEFAELYIYLFDLYWLAWYGSVMFDQFLLQCEGTKAVSMLRLDTEVCCVGVHEVWIDLTTCFQYQSIFDQNEPVTFAFKH